MAFRIYYKARLAKPDRQWRANALDRLRTLYPSPDPPAPVLSVASANSPEAEDFLRQLAPDIVIARCKSLLRKQIFDIPYHGTFVMHPGICPDYRNAHGCFWALAQADCENVGMTLLKIDEGIDTGPIYGHYRCEFDPAMESHIRIQDKVVLDNLDALREKLLEIAAGTAVPIDATGRPSREWGQPWLSAFIRWRKNATGTRSFAWF
jgi:methionyl-tRNA formyltransferase